MSLHIKNLVSRKASQSYFVSVLARLYLHLEHTETIQNDQFMRDVHKVLFVCVAVLLPSQPNGVMSSAVSLPNHTFTGAGLVL